jgi:hypothetical protein
LIYPVSAVFISHDGTLCVSEFLNIYLIDVVSGSVIFSVSHKRAREPVHIVHSENWLIYSYFSDKSRRTEIVTLELYEGKVQSNTTGKIASSMLQLAVLWFVRIQTAEVMSVSLHVSSLTMIE